MSTATSIDTTELVVDFDTPAGAVRALQCPALHIQAGSSAAVMGTSGCGKSTLLGLFAALAVPTRGKVTIGDAVVSELSERERVRFRRRVLGMVYQSDNLLPHLTVEENVGLQLAICARDASRGNDTADVLDRLGLGRLAHRRPDQLSGGQRQRAAVARAVIHRPSVILADEPTGALDEASALQVIELLIEIHQEIGATLVVVSHDPTIAGRLDRIIALHRPARMADRSDAA